MLASGGTGASDPLVRQIRRRLQLALILANGAGGLVVFAFANFVLPTPNGLHHGTRLLLINTAVFAATGLVAMFIANLRSRRMWLDRFGWAQRDRVPTESERERTLRYPLVQTALIAKLWALAMVLFAALNAPFSGEIAGNSAITIALGGLVTCAAGYLLTERIIRPLTARALAGGVPSRPQLPGVAARALLSWALGTGVVLLGIALIGVGGLHEKRFTAQRLSIAMLVLSVVGLVVGLAIMLALVRSLADPVEALRHAAGRVEQGDLDHEVDVNDGSEVGLLQAAFNRMVAGLRERERLRDLFGRQVGEDVVRHALERGFELGGEACEAAALFVDLERSTALAETRDPAEVVRLLNSFFEVVVAVVGSHSGWVNKFEGDAALCVFGVPLPDPDAASHALAAARELRDRLASEVPQIRAGIGVSAGRVVAGNVGAARRFEYTVIGDAVNEAARLTELAKGTPERLLASEAALSRAGEEEAEHWEIGEEVSLRGRSAATKIAAPA
jgi:adenylate cyclase